MLIGDGHRSVDDILVIVQSRIISRRKVQVQRHVCRIWETVLHLQIGNTTANTLTSYTGRASGKEKGIAKLKPPARTTLPIPSLYTCVSPNPASVSEVLSFSMPNRTRLSIIPGNDVLLHKFWLAGVTLVCDAPSRETLFPHRAIQILRTVHFFQLTSDVINHILQGDWLTLR